MSRLLILLVTLHQVVNLPLDAKENPVAISKIDSKNIPSIVSVNHGDQKLPIVVPLIRPPRVTFVDTKVVNVRKKKGPSIPISLPHPHHLLVSTNLHVIPIHQNVHHSHSTIHGVNIITNDHVHLPVVSHSYTHSSSNVTHPTQLIPILIPIHTHLVPLNDLTVIPLHRPTHTVEQKLSHYRTTMDKKDPEEDEPINRFRSFYGGFGNGLYIGGHGAGHGFYAYG